MEEGEVGGRFSDIRIAAERAKDFGKVIPRDRREAVIIETAQPSIKEESFRTRQEAVRKYWEIQEGSNETPVFVTAPHAEKAGKGELLAILRENFPDRSYSEVEQLVDEWLEAPAETKPHKRLPPDDSNYRIYQAISKLRGRVEQYTDLIARKTAEQVEAAVAVPKKSRMWADANRRSFFLKPRGVRIDGGLIQTKEYPTSVRASLYWAIERQVAKTVGLDSEGKALRPYLQMVIHGMADRKHTDGDYAYDIIIGGGDPRLGESGSLASDDVLRWFGETMARKLNQKVTGFESGLRVAIDKMGDDEIEVFGTDGVKAKGERVGKGISGAGLGLEYFRAGHDFAVENLEGKQRILRLPGFGENFHTVQIEISRRLRYSSEEVREALAGVLAEMASEFIQRQTS